ncbi:MAG TPA: Hsp70 family protein, partial [Gammaproteobacteria bacterium]|nr:Hsp70 family protein [Gammaproteobacteria bacterium]
MALLQIAEPGESTAPHQHKLAVGIDLGTTNSLVAAVRSGVAETLPDEQGRHLLPSVVHYLAGKCEVGDIARDHAVTDPYNTVMSVKRLMGRALADVKSLGDKLPYEFDNAETTVPRIKTANGPKTAIEVSADILRVLKQRGEAT